MFDSEGVFSAAVMEQVSRSYIGTSFKSRLCNDISHKAYRTNRYLKKSMAFIRLGTFSIQLHLNQYSPRYPRYRWQPVWMYHFAMFSGYVITTRVLEVSPLRSRDHCQRQSTPGVDADGGWYRGDGPGHTAPKRNEKRAPTCERKMFELNMKMRWNITFLPQN